MAVQRITTTTLTSSQSNITFSDIANKYDHLMIVLSVRRDSSSGTGSGKIEFNGDTSTSNYTSSAAAASAYFTGSPATTASAAAYTSDLQIFSTGNSSDTTNSFASGKIIIWNYKDTNKWKYASSFTSQWNSSGWAYMINYQGVWKSTNAVTSIKLFPTSGANFISGSTISIYGIMAGTDTATVN